MTLRQLDTLRECRPSSNLNESLTTSIAKDSRTFFVTCLHLIFRSICLRNWSQRTKPSRHFRLSVIEKGERGSGQDRTDSFIILSILLSELISLLFFQDSPLSGLYNLCPGVFDDTKEGKSQSLHVSDCLCWSSDEKILDDLENLLFYTSPKYVHCRFHSFVHVGHVNNPMIRQSWHAFMTIIDCQTRTHGLWLDPQIFITFGVSYPCKFFGLEFSLKQ